MNWFVIEFGDKITEQDGSKTVRTKVTGTALALVIIMVLVIDTLVAANWYFTQHYKSYAAVSGVADIAKMF